MSLENDLKQIGLEEKEARVYLAALELGPTSIKDLTEKSGIKRSTVYEMIKNLEPMGLITESIKGKRKIYIASEPEKLIHTLKSKEQLLKEILPELRSINNTGTIKPKITFYEGKDGLQKIYEDSLSIQKGIMYAISPTQTTMGIVGEDFLNKYIEKRAQKKIRTRLIHITANMADYKYLNPQTFEETRRDVRFAPQNITLDNIIIIYGNKVAILSTRKEGFGFVVESNDYAKTMQVFYYLLWNISKPWHEMNFDKNSQSAENNETEEKEDDYWSAK